MTRRINSETNHCLHKGFKLYNPRCLSKKKKKIHYVTLHSVCIHYVRYFHHDK